MISALGVDRPRWISGVCQSAGFEQPISWPSAQYFSDINETWFVYEVADGAVARDAYCRVFDHDTGLFRDPVKIGDNPLTNDEHGCPTLVRDANSRIMAFWGAHDNGVLKVARTTNPNDETAWTALPDITTNLTYPKPILVGTTVYVFYRKDSERHMAGIWSETTTGNPSWSSNKNIISVQDSGEAGFERCYQTQFRAVGTDIYFMFNETKDDVTEIRDVYMGIFDTTTKTVRNLLKTQSWNSAAQPVLRADCDTYLRAHEYSMAGEEGAFSQWCFGEDEDDIHVMFLKGTDASAMFDYYHMFWNGTVWSTPTVVHSIGERPNTCFAIFNDNGTIKAVMGDDDAGRFAKGASRLVQSSYNGSSWSTPQEFLTAHAYGFSKIAAVKDPHPKCLVTISEVTSAESVEAGDIKIFGYAPDAGLLKDTPSS